MTIPELRSLALSLQAAHNRQGGDRAIDFASWVRIQFDNVDSDYHADARAYLIELSDGDYPAAQVRT